MAASKQASDCPKHKFAKAICPVAKYKSNLCVIEMIDGIVMKQYAAQAFTNADVFLV